MDQAVDELLNIIANGGVIGTCGKLCSELPHELEATVCDLLCDYVGIDEFIKLVQDVDPDPIWLCQEIKVCPLPTDDPVASITSFAVTPQQGPQGHEFTFTIEFNITNDIGTGEFVFEVDPADGTDDPIGTEQVLIQPAPGLYSASFRVPTHPNKNEQWVPGVYPGYFAVCTGGCGSKHDGAHTLAESNVNFTLTAPTTMPKKMKKL
jgi:hypothetical protein